jgi:hypothetical protein
MFLRDTVRFCAPNRFVRRNVLRSRARRTCTCARGPEKKKRRGFVRARGGEAGVRAERGERGVKGVAAERERASEREPGRDSMRQKGGERSASQIRFSTKWQLCCPWGTVRIAIIKMAPATYALLMDPHLSIFLLASSARPSTPSSETRFLPCAFALAELYRFGRASSA